MMDPASLDEDFEEDEHCAICGEVERMRSVVSPRSRHKQEEEVPLLECGRCLWGYHLDCLENPLSAVPQVCQPLPHNFVSILCAI